MTTQVKTTLEKFELAEAALKSGLLIDYAPAQPLLNEPESKVPTSWGPAMRK
jgi:hypothetical protein